MVDTLLTDTLDEMDDQKLNKSSTLVLAPADDVQSKYGSGDGGFSSNSTRYTTHNIDTSDISTVLVHIANAHMSIGGPMAGFDSGDVECIERLVANAGAQSCSEHQSVQPTTSDIALSGDAFHVLGCLSASSPLCELRSNSSGAAAVLAPVILVARSMVISQILATDTTVDFYDITTHDANVLWVLLGGGFASLPVAGGAIISGFDGSAIADAADADAMLPFMGGQAAYEVGPDPPNHPSPGCLLQRGGCQALASGLPCCL